MVIQNRWSETLQSLQSIYYSDQDKSSFDVYLIDNGSSEENVDNVKEFVKSGMLPVKNLFCMSEMSISKAWNLFLAVSQDYDYRTKYDNDMVLHGTLATKPTQVPQNAVIGGSNPGSIPSGPPIRGIGHHNKHKIVQLHTAFLDHLQEFSKKYNVDATALIPVIPGQFFGKMMEECASKTWQGLPYLFGACIMISKKCFDMVGYFDERLSRRIDIEYTNRIVKQNMNIGYHPAFYATHIGAVNSTEPKDIREKRYTEATKISENAPLDGRVPSFWENMLPRLIKSASKTQVLCLK